MAERRAVQAAVRDVGLVRVYEKDARVVGGVRRKRPDGRIELVVSLGAQISKRGGNSRRHQRVDPVSRRLSHAGLRAKIAVDVDSETLWIERERCKFGGLRLILPLRA